MAGILVVLGVYFFDKIGIDNPVGKKCQNR